MVRRKVFLTAALVAPIPLAGLATSAAATVPLSVEPRTSATSTATFTAPTTARSGDVIAGTPPFAHGYGLGCVAVSSGALLVERSRSGASRRAAG